LSSASRLDTERIAAAALRVADHRGAAGFTIKAVADVLGVTPMAIYHHVENKADLVALLVEVAAREHPMPAPSPAGWRESLLELARWIRNSMIAHPAVGQLQLQYKVWTPASLAMGEHWVSLWLQSGLDHEAAVQSALLSSVAILGMVREEMYLHAFEPPEETKLGLLPNLRSMYRAKFEPGTAFDVLVRSVIEGLYASASAAGREDGVVRPRRRGRLAAGDQPIQRRR
jgi:AcrR family transcriptional regulator